MRPKQNRDSLEKIKQDLVSIQPRQDSFLALWRSCLMERDPLIFPDQIVERLIGTYLVYNLEDQYGPLAPAVTDVLSRPETVQADFVCADDRVIDDKSVLLPTDLPGDLIVGALSDEEKSLLYHAHKHNALAERVPQDAPESQLIEASSLLIFAASRVVLLDCSLAYRYMDIVHRLADLGWDSPMAKWIDGQIKMVYQSPGSPIFYWPDV